MIIISFLKLYKWLQKEKNKQTNKKKKKKKKNTTKNYLFKNLITKQRLEYRKITQTKPNHV